MTFSGLANQIRESAQSSDRRGTTIDTFLIHHQAGTNDDAVINEMVNQTKQVSANYTINSAGRITGVVPEELRAWTSGSTLDGGRGAAWDRRAITVEIENAGGAPDWPISAAAHQAAAALLQDLRTRYGVSIVLGHRDLWDQYRASYPTFCPGPDTVAAIVALAGGGSVTVPTSSGGTITVGNFAFGLTEAAQLAAQQALAAAGLYSGLQDGAFGSLSVRAFQTYLKTVGLLAADYVVDGTPGPLYGSAVETLASQHGYTGPIDGDPGGQTSLGIIAWAQSVMTPPPAPPVVVPPVVVPPPVVVVPPPVAPPVVAPPVVAPPVVVTPPPVAPPVVAPPVVVTPPPVVAPPVVVVTPPVVPPRHVAKATAKGFLVGLLGFAALVAAAIGGWLAHFGH
jgi:peptidoglycan hydrolase-like protein with peptidoglycan-binding domain